MTRRVVGLNRPKGVERDPHDFYATCPTSIPPLLGLLGWLGGGKIIWENSCGEGHLSEPLKIFGHTVLSTDLIDRGYGIPGIDFLAPSWLHEQRYDAVVMNPPYKDARAFVERSLEVAPLVCAFLRLSFLESAGRKEFFKLRPPKYVAVFSDRVKSAKGGNWSLVKKGGTVAYAWFVWEKGYDGDTIVKWI